MYQDNSQEIALIQKYNVSLPRYTSYPTVPYWDNTLDIQKWKEKTNLVFSTSNSKNGISLYLHLPFCEHLCTYCGCNKKITLNHSVEERYIKAILTEWNLYLNLFTEKPILRELHLGGGTPTFFSPKNLDLLIGTILTDCKIHDSHSFSFEGHPNNTTQEHLTTLFALGFKRVSFGVQDLDNEVQTIINRIQPFENVEKVTHWAREIGYTSINFDLIYGLPKQNIDSISKTITKVLQLKPDRIAFYSYAHVPWTSKAQRLFDESDLPSSNDKLSLYLKGKNLLVDAGYLDIGMDHFALPGDELFIASENGFLHRNFMGYTTQHSGMLIGLGVSSISDIGIGYAQNHKTLAEYFSSVAKSELPLTKGYFLAEIDLVFKNHILELSCQGKTSLSDNYRNIYVENVSPKLEKLSLDKLLIINHNTIEITSKGKNFIRNICSAFDLKLNDLSDQTSIFSKAI